MFYEKYPYLCISAFCFSILATCLSPREDMSVRIEDVSAKEIQTATGKTASGVSMEIPTGRKEDNKKEGKGNNKPTYKEYAMSSGSNAPSTCDAGCKISELTKKGIRDEIAKSLVINCKALTDDPVKCIKIGASIVKNESGGGYKCKKYNKYNCFGISVKDEYKSYNDGVVNFIGKYNKHWYKAQNMAFFYSPAGKLPPSRFCTSEHSSNSEIGCPNGLKISSGIFNSLNF